MIFANKLRLVAATAAVSCLTACGSNPIVTPYDAHPPAVAKSETTVLISMDRQASPPILATIVKIDSKDVACDWNAGCPVWARLAPGDHEFVIRFRTDFYGVPGATNSGFKVAELPVRIPAMQATHVYVLRYSRVASSNSIAARVEDMGARARTGIQFPFGVANAIEYIADF